MLNQIAAIHRVNSQIYTFPFSVEPLFAEGRSSELLITRMGLFKKPLLARDERTRSKLEGFGLETQHRADIAFKLRNAMPKRANERLEKNTVILAVTGRKKKLSSRIGVCAVQAKQQPVETDTDDNLRALGRPIDEGSCAAIWYRVLCPRNLARMRIQNAAG